MTIVLNSWGSDYAEAQHTRLLRIEAQNCTLCIKVFSKPTNFSMHRQIHKQLLILHSMLEEFKPQVTTHSTHCHHAQQTMQPSMEMFCIEKPAHCPVTIVLNSWGPDCS